MKDQVALITGGARMGEAIALALAEKGCNIILAYHRSKEPAYTTVRKVKSMGRKAVCFKIDITNLENISALISRIKNRFGRLDILVNLASVYEKTPLTLALSPKGRRDKTWKKWQQSMDVHLSASYRLALEAARLMKKSKWARMIFVSDWTAASGRPRYKGYLPYYTAKGGLLALTQALALELAPNILVNSIAPGPILPFRGMSRGEAREVIQNTPLKRWGGAEEIAKAVGFLADTQFITGECIRVDGGRHLY